MPIPIVELVNSVVKPLTPTPETSLATTNQAAANRIITTPDEYRQRLAGWAAQHFNVLTPSIEMTGLAVQHGLVACKVQLDLNEDGGDIYGKLSDGKMMPWLKPHERAIAKTGLRKIASAAGISTTSIRTDPRTIPNYWEMKTIASWRDIDGSVCVREATKDWDARDGADLLKGFTPNQIQQARKNGLRHCESRSANAAIREYGLKQKYTLDELAKPFIVVRVMFMPDMTDPATRQILTESYVRGTSALYAHTQPAALPAASDILDVEAVAPVAARTAAADPHQPPTPGAVRIATVDSKSGEKNGRKWTRYAIVDSLGVEHSTFDVAIADFAKKARDTQQWVEIAEESDGPYRNLLEITAAGLNPSLLPDTGSL
jgi:hypothetical protein